MYIYVEDITRENTRNRRNAQRERHIWKISLITQASKNNKLLISISVQVLLIYYKNTGMHEFNDFTIKFHNFCSYNKKCLQTIYIHTCAINIQSKAIFHIGNTNLITHIITINIPNQ